MQHVGGRLEVWPWEFALASGILYNQQRWVEKRRLQKAATKYHIHLDSGHVPDWPGLRSEEKLRGFNDLWWLCTSPMKVENEEEKAEEVSLQIHTLDPQCVQAQSSLTLSHSTHKYISGNKRNRKETDYIFIISVVVFLCYTTLCAKSLRKCSTKIKSYYECNPLTSWHKITLDRLTCC